MSFKTSNVPKIFQGVYQKGVTHMATAWSITVWCLCFPSFPALTYNFPNSLFPDLKGVRSLLGSKGKQRKWSSPHILHATSANQASKVILSQKLTVGHLLPSVILQINLIPSPFKSKTYKSAIIFLTIPFLGMGSTTQCRAKATPILSSPKPQPPQPKFLPYFSSRPSRKQKCPHMLMDGRQGRAHVPLVISDSLV